MKFIVLIPLILLQALLTGCSQPTGPEQAIRQQVEALETALAERDRGDALEILADGFLGGAGGQLDKDKEAADKMLAVYFLRYHRIRVVISQLEITLDPYQPALAEASAQVALAGGERLIPNSAGLYQVNARWQNIDGDWQITRLQWQ